MKSQYTPNPGTIYFQNGDPVNATHASLSGLDAVYALFGWMEGAFEFTSEDVKVARSIKSNRMEIVLDALRMLDDDMVEKVGPPTFDEAAEKGKTESKDGLTVVKGPLVDYAHVVAEEEYSDGQRVVREGGHGKWLWVILQGNVKVVKETENGPFTIALLGEGCFVGSFKALTFRDNVRRASVYASGEVQLGLLDTERLSIEYTSLSPTFRSLLASLDNRLGRVTERVSSLFTNEDNMKGLTKDKKVVLKKGSAKEEIFTILDGEIYVMGQSRKGNLPLLSLGKDDFFGRVPFLDIGHEPRSASILASEDLKVNKLDKGSIQGEYDSLSGTFRNMIYNVGTSIFMTTKRAYQIHEGGS